MIQYVDRATGKVETEKIYGHKALSLSYGDSLASRFFSLFFLPFFARLSWFSRFYGYLQKRPKSAEKIAPFIAAYGLDATEFADWEFRSFNDFFIRKLKPERRPIDPGPRTLAMPADGRYLVFPDLRYVEGFYVKGQQFDLPSFLQDSAYANRYRSGSMAIARLCPTDYHRFHFPCGGIPSKARAIHGPLFSVNPIALRKRLSILWENKRMVTEIDGGAFGTILYVEVGATCVGTIHQTYHPDQTVEKGDEKGYFSFGGSCLVLLFERGRISFDEDLVENTKRGLETKALFGTRFGRLID
jgi:phosphatidylserine decarboxylase